MARRRTGQIEARRNAAGVITSYRIRYTDIRGLRQYETYATREEADVALAERLHQVVKGVPVSRATTTVLFGELAVAVLKDYATEDYATIDDQERRFRLHILPELGDMRASEITKDHIRDYILKRRAEGSKDGNTNKELQLINHAFHMGIQDGKIFQKPDVPQLDESDAIRTGFFTREEVDRLVGHLKRPTAQMVLFGFLTGWRRGEILNLLWKNIDFDANVMRLEKGKSTKNRKGRVFPMSIEIRALLLELRPPHRFGVEERRVFEGATENFKRSWKTACYKAGLPCDIAPIQIRSKVQKRVKVLKAHRTFHDLRRSFARHMDQKGIRQKATMALGGWITSSVFDRYNIVSEADLKDAIDIVNADHEISIGSPENPKVG